MLDMMLENALGFPVCLMNNPHVQFLIQIGWWSYLYNTSILVLLCCYNSSKSFWICLWEFHMCLKRSRNVCCMFRNKHIFRIRIWEHIFRLLLWELRTSYSNGIIGNWNLLYIKNVEFPNNWGFLFQNIL